MIHTSTTVLCGTSCDFELGLKMMRGFSLAYTLVDGNISGHMRKISGINEHGV